MLGNAGLGNLVVFLVIVEGTVLKSLFGLSLNRMCSFSDFDLLTSARIKQKPRDSFEPPDQRISVNREQKSGGTQCVRNCYDRPRKVTNTTNYKAVQ